jgi:hypothetical protein
MPLFGARGLFSIWGQKIEKSQNVKTYQMDTSRKGNIEEKTMQTFSNFQSD